MQSSIIETSYNKKYPCVNYQITIFQTYISGDMLKKGKYFIPDFQNLKSPEIKIKGPGYENKHLNLSFYLFLEFNLQFMCT